MEPVLLNLCRTNIDNVSSPQEQQIKQKQQTKKKKGEKRSRSISVDKVCEKRSRRESKNSSSVKCNSSNSSSSSSRKNRIKLEKKQLQPVKKKCGRPIKNNIHQFRITVDFCNGNLNSVGYNRIPVKKESESENKLLPFDCKVMLSFEKGHLVGIDSERTSSSANDAVVSLFPGISSVTAAAAEASSSSAAAPTESPRTISASDKEYFEFLSQCNEEEIEKMQQDASSVSQGSIVNVKAEEKHREKLFLKRVREVKERVEDKKTRATEELKTKLQSATSDAERSAWRNCFRDLLASIEKEKQKKMRALGNGYINERNERMKTAGLIDSKM